MEKLVAKEAIRNGKTYLGIELGSTRIKAVLIGENHETLVFKTTWYIESNQ